jgi:hypothetical protein
MKMHVIKTWVLIRIFSMKPNLGLYLDLSHSTEFGSGYGYGLRKMHGFGVGPETLFS